MPIQITNAIIHHLGKIVQSQGANSVIVKLGEDSLPINNSLQRLCDELVKMYSGAANSNGTLGIDPEVHKFTAHLRSYLENQQDFMEFTKAAVGLIAEHMGASFLATGGYALFLRYNVDGLDFLFVVMLKLTPKTGINEETLSLTEGLSIELSQLHEAARVNLTRWQGNQQPYLTFIKGRSKKGEVSEYFREALACTSFTDSKHNTEAIIRAVSDFVESRTDLTAEEKSHKKIEARGNLFECLERNKDEVPLTTIAASINPDAPEDFIDYIESRRGRDGDYHLDSRFKPDRKIYTGLKRVKGKMGTVSVAFDVADVQAERVRYDASSNSIILTAPSDQLRDAIQEYAPAAS